MDRYCERIFAFVALSLAFSILAERFMRRAGEGVKSNLLYLDLDSNRELLAWITFEDDLRSKRERLPIPSLILTAHDVYSDAPSASGVEANISIDSESFEQQLRFVQQL